MFDGRCVKAEGVKTEGVRTVEQPDQDTSNQ